MLILCMAGTKRYRSTSRSPAQLMNMRRSKESRASRHDGGPRQHEVGVCYTKRATCKGLYTGDPMHRALMYLYCICCRIANISFSFSATDLRYLSPPLWVSSGDPSFVYRPYDCVCSHQAIGLGKMMRASAETATVVIAMDRHRTGSPPLLRAASQPRDPLQGLHFYIRDLCLPLLQHFMILLNVSLL